MEISWVAEGGVPRRVHIQVDGEFKKKVSNSIVPIRELQALKTDGSFFDHLHALEVKGGIRYALFCLSRQALHSKKLEKNLQRHFLEPAVITMIIDHCQKLGVLDDNEWIQGRIRRWQSQGKSTADVKSRLRREGILIRDMAFDDQASLERLVTRKYPQLLETKTPYKERMRAMQSLQRRGFSFHIVQEFLQKKRINTMMGEESVET